MIFVTTGTQAPFNRLVRAMDEIAADLKDEEIIVQAFEVDFEPLNLKVVGFLEPAAYTELFDRARLIVSHAGMGSIVSALTTGKPIIVMPRKASLQEHRNDHQIDTARKMETLQSIPVAYEATDLKPMILKMLAEGNPKPVPATGRFASSSLIQSVRNFINKQTNK